MIRLLASAAALALVMTGTAATAQPKATGKAADEVLIRVDLTEVTPRLAADLGIEEDGVPRSVEIPVEAAAEVCEFTEDQLAFFATSEQHLECNASAVTDELAQAAAEARKLEEKEVK